MIFTPDNATKIMSRTKTQTRRIIKPLEFATYLGTREEIYAVWKETKSPFHAMGELVRAPLVILERMNRLKWATAGGVFRDKTYAVQPGRGKFAIGRIRIIAIRKERLQDISPDDCFKEGIRLPTLPHETPDKFTEAYRALWNKINYLTGETWEDNPEVWVLEFEPVKAAEEAASV